MHLIVLRYAYKNVLLLSIDFPRSFYIDTMSRNDDQWYTCARHCPRRLTYLWQVITNGGNIDDDDDVAFYLNEHIVSFSCLSIRFILHVTEYWYWSTNIEIRWFVNSFPFSSQVLGEEKSRNSLLSFWCLTTTINGWRIINGTKRFPFFKTLSNTVLETPL